jgi:uncharacterized protein YndB with AHSA1/START domain
LIGTYLRMEPPEKLVFTWSGGAAESWGTVITLDFLDLGSMTELVLTQEGLSAPERRARAEGGWPSLLDALAEVLSSSRLDL